MFLSFLKQKHINYYSYLDWIRDLEWIEANEFAFIIHNFDQLLVQSPKERAIVINSLDKTVIPWWQNGIIYYQVQGKPKKFNVYLVN